MKTILQSIGLALICAFAQAEPIHFAIIGDTPYSTNERIAFPAMLTAIGNSGAQFVAHIGDFKGGQERCDDAVYHDRQQLFDASRIPFIFIPGDNEWTDCDRLTNGRYDPLERLAFLRRIFFPGMQTLGQRRFNMEQQPGPYPEHLRFRQGDALFVTLNLPGGNNNWGLTDTPSTEYQQRNPQVLAWLKAGFAKAKAENLKAIVLLFQADPGFKHFSQRLPHRYYADFLNLLRDESEQFPGQVIAIHGDTHIARVDQPMRLRNGKLLHNFTRIESYGYPYLGWIDVTLDGTALSTQMRPWPTRAK